MGYGEGQATGPKGEWAGSGNSPGSYGRLLWGRLLTDGFWSTDNESGNAFMWRRSRNDLNLDIRGGLSTGRYRARVQPNFSGFDEIGSISAAHECNGLTIWHCSAARVDSRLVQLDAIWNPLIRWAKPRRVAPASCRQDRCAGRGAKCRTGGTLHLYLKRLGKLMPGSQSVYYLENVGQTGEGVFVQFPVQGVAPTAGVPIVDQTWKGNPPRG